MADGFVSLATGLCVPTEQEAAQSLCAGYPKATFGQYGLDSRELCEVATDGTGLAHVVFTKEGAWGAYMWGENRDVPLTVCEITPNPWDLSVADALLVAGAIVGVWLLAWGIRAARIALN